MNKFIMNPYYQTLYVVWGNQILFFSMLFYFLFVHNNYYILLLFPIALFTFGAMSEISLHRYYTHKSYNTSKFKDNILKLFAFLTGQGAIISWVTVHRYHHAFEDTELDPHSPLHRPAWKIFLGIFPKNYKKNLVTDLLKSKSRRYYLFENKYYWLMWSSLWILSFLINPVIFFFIVAGSAIWYIVTGNVNYWLHKGPGHKEHNDAVGYNSSFANLLCGAGHHNNHHKNPRSYTYSTGKEKDPYAWVIEKFFIIKE